MERATKKITYSLIRLRPYDSASSFAPFHRITSQVDLQDMLASRLKVDPTAHQLISVFITIHQDQRHTINLERQSNLMSHVRKK